MADEESARHVGGVQPRSTAWRGFLSDGRRMADPGVLDVLGDREGQRPLDRSRRPVVSGRLARHRSRLVHRARRHAAGLCHRRRDRHDRLGLRSPRLGRSDPHDRSPRTSRSKAVARKLGSTCCAGRAGSPRRTNICRWKSGGRRASSGARGKAFGHDRSRRARRCRSIGRRLGAAVRGRVPRSVVADRQRRDASCRGGRLRFRTISTC